MLGYELTLTSQDGELRESVDPTPSYCYQLQAFADAVLRGKRPPTDGADALATAVVLDALYEEAGLQAPSRPRTPGPGRRPASGPLGQMKAVRAIDGHGGASSSSGRRATASVSPLT